LGCGPSISLIRTFSPLNVLFFLRRPLQGNHPASSSPPGIALVRTTFYELFQGGRLVLLIRPSAFSLSPEPYPFLRNTRGSVFFRRPFFPLKLSRSSGHGHTSHLFISLVSFFKGLPEPTAPGSLVVSLPELKFPTIAASF